MLSVMCLGDLEIWVLIDGSGGEWTIVAPGDALGMLICFLLWGQEYKLSIR